MYKAISLPMSVKLLIKYNISYTPGRECDNKPATGGIRACPNYELRNEGSTKTKGKFPQHS